MLRGWGIRQRADDGRLLWTNISNPTSRVDALTIGLRYEKRDGTLTEDLFTIDAAKPDEVASHYRGKLQKIWKEYDSTHKQQNLMRESFTLVIHAASTWVQQMAANAPAADRERQSAISRICSAGSERHQCEIRPGCSTG